MQVLIINNRNEKDIKIYKKGMLASFYVSGHLSNDLGS
jgi:hypothetical protein